MDRFRVSRDRGVMGESAAAADDGKHRHKSGDGDRGREKERRREKGKGRDHLGRDSSSRQKDRDRGDRDSVERDGGRRLERSKKERHRDDREREKPRREKDENGKDRAAREEVREKEDREMEKAAREAEERDERERKKARLKEWEREESKEKEKARLKDGSEREESMEVEKVMLKDERGREVSMEGEKARLKDERRREEAKEREKAKQKEERGREEAKEREKAELNEEREREESKELEKAKLKDEEDREESKELKKARHKDEREREESKELEKAKLKDERGREEAKEREKARIKEESDREKTKERDREDREQEKAKDREREDREREKAKEREADRRKEREREERERERARRREREREKEREKDRAKERERLRDRENKRERDRTEERDAEDGKDPDRKRRRREDSHERDLKRSSRPERHREGSEEAREKKKSLEEEEEAAAAEEHRKLEEEMEKRRRRVQEWQEMKRRKEEEERGALGDDNADEHPSSGKNWTLEGESDEEEANAEEPNANDMAVDGDSENPGGAGGDSMVLDSVIEANSVPNGTSELPSVEEEEIDPLDAFMNSVVLPEVEKVMSAEPVAQPVVVHEPEKKRFKHGVGNGDIGRKGTKNPTGWLIPGEESDSDYADMENEEASLEDEDDDEFMKRVKKTKVEKLSLVDHTKIQYPQFRKNFYIEVKEISRMTPEDVLSYRKQLELKIHGKDVPKPIKTWIQTGLTSKTLDTIKKLNFERPMPIQAQALPIIMSGRDCIGIAKTGSGKTLAFVLPMLRHIKDQPPVMPGDGPIALIMAPTRELVQQIHSDVKKFVKALGINCVPVYGGAGVAQQISDLKRGTEIVVCTPGRMIDILCTGSGKITNLRRVTYFVMDEADRMFDMGFEPQITRIIQNTQPDRQTVLFSATFPRQVEILARKVLNKPVEIQVGGRSVVNKDIAQLVEVRPENERFLRLLELLGEWYEKGKILVFVHSQDKCDSLFKELLKHGYPCLSLHGAKDQTDRESTIADFKTNVCNLLIATSVAARGLDVKELELVVNFDVPNHYEDYVHRVGRTGRAGRKGFAVTFISEEDARYAPDLVKALELSEQAVPADLKALADGFMAKVNQGMEQLHGTGYGGSGFKFNEEEEDVRKAAKKALAREYGFEEDKSDSDSDDEVVRKAGGDLSLAQAAAIAAAAKAAMNTPATAAQLISTGGVPAVTLPGVAGLPAGASAAAASIPSGEASAMANALAAAINLQHNLAKIHADAMPEHYEAELEINDFPQNARWKITHKETLGPISEWTGAAITTRGQHCPSGRIPTHGERKLYLFIEGPTESSVKKAKAELKRVLEDYTNQALSLPGPSQPGKYSVI